MMAKIHFVKDGLTKQGTASTTSEFINAEELEPIFSGYEYRFFEQPPIINPEKLVNDFAGYQHVVLEIEDGESTKTFPNVGYYFLPTLSVAVCKEIRGLT
jgi:hypothetical protein